MWILVCKEEFEKLFFPSDSVSELNHVKLKKLKLNIVKVLLEGLGLYWSRGWSSVSLNGNRNKPVIVLSVKVHEEVQIPVALTRDKKNSEENTESQY